MANKNKKRDEFVEKWIQIFRLIGDEDIVEIEGEKWMRGSDLITDLKIILKMIYEQEVKK